MLRRVLRENETREYRVLLERSQHGGYTIADIGDVEEKYRGLVSNYIDTLMSDSDLIPGDVDRVLVNLKETENTLTCEVKTLS
jgi:hypothetical protein